MPFEQTAVEPGGTTTVVCDGGGGLLLLRLRQPPSSRVKSRGNRRIRYPRQRWVAGDGRVLSPYKTVCANGTTRTLGLPGPRSAGTG